MPVFAALVLVCLRKLCQAYSAICSCSDAILPFFSIVINNPTAHGSLSSTSTSGQERGGDVVPYVTSKVMHIAGWGKGESGSEHLEERMGEPF